MLKGGENVMANDLLKKSIESVKKASDELINIAKQSDDVKSGKCTLEEELKEPGYVLFRQISESSIKILENTAINQAVEELSEHIGKDATVHLAELITIAMTNAAYYAVLSYDDILKEELSKQFENISHHINLSKSDIEGHAAVLSVFRKRISDIEDRIKKSDINDMINKKMKQP